MDRDELFLETLRDLDRRSSASDVTAYEILRSSLLIRQLLLDQHPLVRAVNKGRDVELRFRINGRKPIWMLAGTERPVFWTIQDGLDPETALTLSVPATVDLEQFLSHVIMVSRGSELTVKDVVRQVAHISGGVHAGAPREEVERVLLEVSESISVGGLDPVTRSLLAIGRIVVRSLEPLAERIESERRT
jgi:hypothetical protein